MKYTGELIQLSMVSGEHKNDRGYYSHDYIVAIFTDADGNTKHMAMAPEETLGHFYKELQRAVEDYRKKRKEREHDRIGYSKTSRTGGPF